MIATSAPFATMVENGVSYNLTWRIEIDLPGGIYPDVTISADAVEVESTITTDLPSGTRLEEGYASDQATFTLAGRIDPADKTKTAAWLFGLYSTTSPLYHSDAFMCPVRVFVGGLPDQARGTSTEVRKFTGYVEDYTLNPDGSVAFTCYDGAQVLRNVPDIPAVVTAPPYNAGLTSEFAVDALLRTATKGLISSWPAQRPGCVLAVGGRASVTPEVGTLRGTLGQTPIFIPGVFGSAMSESIPSWDLAGTVGTNGFAEWFSVNTVPGSHEVQIQSFTVGDGVQVAVTNTGTASSVTITLFVAAVAAGSHTVTIAPTDTYIGVAFSWAVGSTAFTAAVTTASAVQAVSISATSARSAVFDNSFAALTGNSFEGFQVTTETAPVSNVGFDPQALIDPSLNPLQLVPEIPAGSDPWATIQTIAQAELAVARFDESTGKFRYQNRITVASQPIARTITSKASLGSVGGIVSSAASVLNRGQVGYTGWAYANTPSVAWSAQKVRSVLPHQSLTINIALPNFFVLPDSSFSVLPDGTTSTTTSVFRASTSRDGLTEHPDPSKLIFTLTQPSPNLMNLVITNNSGTPAFFVSPANYTDLPVGTILLQFAATAVVANTEIVTDYQWPPLNADGTGGAASSRFGEVAYSQTGNAWIQDAGAALLLNQTIINQSYQPTPSFTGMEILLDPRLQVGDLVTVTDERTGADDVVRIFGSTISIQEAEPGDEPTYTHTIDGVALGPPGCWLAGIPGRSEAGVTTYVAA